VRNVLAYSFKTPWKWNQFERMMQGLHDGKKLVIRYREGKGVHAVGAKVVGKINWVASDVRHTLDDDFLNVFANLAESRHSEDSIDLLDRDTIITRLNWSKGDKDATVRRENGNGSDTYHKVTHVWVEA